MTAAELKAELKKLEEREKELKREKRVLEFRKLSPKEQRILKALGLDPFRDEAIETTERKFIKL